MSMAGVPALFTLLGFIGKRRYIAAVLGPPPVFVFAFLFFFYFRQWSPTMGLVPAVIFVPWSLLFAGFAWEPRLRAACERGTRRLQQQLFELARRQRAQEQLGSFVFQRRA